MSPNNWNEGSPPGRFTVSWRLIGVAPAQGFALHVTFGDGTKGEVDLRTLLTRKSVEGTAFEALRDPAVFGQVHLALGAVQWPNGADLAPDAMYEAIRATGRWVVPA